MTPEPAEPTPFDVQAISSGSTYVLVVRGDLDLVTSPDLGRALSGALTEGAQTVVVDLSAVTFLALAAMTVLVEAATMITGPHRFAVVADGPMTLRPLTLVRSDEVLSIHSTRMAALAATL